MAERNALRASSVVAFPCLAYSAHTSAFLTPCMCAAHTSGLRTQAAKSEASSAVSSET